MRAFLRAGTAGLRNLPTIDHIINEDYEACLHACDNTTASELNKTLEKIRSAENMMMILGIMEILEIYAVASLDSQNSFWFPTQIMQSINEAKTKIKALAIKWKWSEHSLEISGIGSPKSHIENLKKGAYKAHVPVNSMRKNQRFLKEKVDPEKMLWFGRTFNNNLFDEEDQLILDFAGEMVTIGDVEKIEPKVTKKLQAICKSLSEVWDERHTETGLQSESMNTFSKPHDLSDQDSASSLAFLRDRLNVLIQQLPPNQAELFDPVSCTPGFFKWNTFFGQNKEKQIHKTWKKWIESLSESEKKDYEMFIDIFQNIQIRSMSEAICETVGSMMVTHGGKGRYLQPTNFSIEMFLRFNLGPLHHLKPFALKILEKRKKEYIKKTDRSNELFTDTSTAVQSSRQRQEEKAKLPLQLWK